MTPRGDKAGKAWEGLRLELYRCPARAWTIGYGHKLSPDELRRGIFVRGISLGQAETLWQHDVTIVEAALAAHVTVPLNDNQRDALTLLGINAGVGVFSGTAPKLMAAIAREDWPEAARQFLDIDHVEQADGTTLHNAGLHNRRAAEAALFSCPLAEIDPDEVLAVVGITLDAMHAEMELATPTGRDRDG